MNDARDDRRRREDQPLDEHMPAVPTTVRRRRQTHTAGGMATPWFGSISTARTDTATRVDEILAERFRR